MDKHLKILSGFVWEQLTKAVSSGPALGSTVVLGCAVGCAVGCSVDDDGNCCCIGATVDAIEGSDDDNNDGGISEVENE